MTKVRTGFIFDYMGSFDEAFEEEAEKAKEQLELMGLEIEVVGVKFGMVSVFDRAELMIIDYGGTLPGADDMVFSLMRAVRQWADDHPGGLVVIWTHFTANIYYNEIHDQFGELNNVIYRSQPYLINIMSDKSGIDEMEECEETIKKWFGVDNGKTKSR